MRSFTEEQKVEILMYAETCGLTNAMRLYKVDTATIQEWNKTRQATKYSDETKQMITDFAKRYSIADAARKFALPGHLIKKWLQATNGKHK